LWVFLRNKRKYKDTDVRKTRAANRLNARKSAVPKTLVGTHSQPEPSVGRGISTHFKLDDESRDELSLSLEILLHELAPGG
jgi:hypothetical protein